jgi:integrase
VPDKAEPEKNDDPKAFIAAEGGLAARWRGRRLADIRRAEIIAMLDDVVDSGRPVAANRMLAALRTLFNWAIERDLLQVNPCTGVRAPTAETSRERVLTDDEIRLLWKATGRQGSSFSRFVRLLLLTGQRRDEVGRMRWSEIEDDLWRLAGERTKNARAHAVPLSGAARDVLASLPRIAWSDYVFTTTGRTPSRNYARGKAGLDALMRAVAEEEGMPAPEPWRLHDLRRTVASGMARLGINLPVIEKVLNHASGSFAGIVGVYQRYSFADEKRQALEAWAQHILDLAGETEAENVVPLRARL